MSMKNGFSLPNVSISERFVLLAKHDLATIESSGKRL
jgi:hypothetical protein